MINFVVPPSEHYTKILNSMIDPIKSHLSNYTESTISQDNCINVHFFREFDYLNTVGLKGINLFISHGIADKNWRNADKVKWFDYVVVSGDLWYDKMIKQGLPKEKIFIGGYPKLDLMFNKSKTIKDENVILWCPTHSCNDSEYTLSTYPKFEQYLNQIPSKYKVKISTHPANRENKKSTIEEIIDADIIVADSGSTLYEAWFLNKPVIFPDFIVKKDIMTVYPNSFEEYIYKNNIGYHARDMNEFNYYLDLAIKNGLDNKTKQFAEGILPNRLRGCSGKTIAEFLVDKCKGIQ